MFCLLLQTDAAVNSGNSGGGLFNLDGELIGIVNAKYAEEGVEDAGKKYLHLEPFGMLPMALTIVFGILLGQVKFPLPGGMSFSLGTAGGPLFIGLIVGHFGHIGPISITAPTSTVKVMRELGLCLFLLGAGTDAGQGFVEVLMAQGIKLFVFGIIVTLVPMILACIVARFMRLDTLTTLGSVCGGMTSTPALGTLIHVTGTEDVASAYAATYPIALISVVLVNQLLIIFFS